MSETPKERIPKELITRRIQQFLRGLVDTSDLYQMVLTHRGQIIGSAYPLEELERTRLDFLMRQLAKAGDSARGSAHGELVQSDLYARSFWYGAGLFGFTIRPYSIDFVRHRCKQVARELVHLLELLQDEPDGPSKIAPR